MFACACDNCGHRTSFDLGCEFVWVHRMRHDLHNMYLTCPTHSRSSQENGDDDHQQQQGGATLKGPRRQVFLIA
jgi:hypothetical protein